MALNWTMLNPNRIPVPLPHEMTVTTVNSGVGLSLTIPDAPPAGASAAGGSGGIKKLEASGSLYLTDQRFIFISEPHSVFESLSVPLPAVLSTRFEQPTFRANYLSFEVRPSPEGGLTDGTQVEIRFGEMYQFATLLDKCRERATFMKRQNADEEEGLPSYSTPAESSTGSIPVDNPPSYD